MSWLVPVHTPVLGQHRKQVPVHTQRKAAKTLVMAAHIVLALPPLAPLVLRMLAEQHMLVGHTERTP